MLRYNIRRQGYALLLTAAMLAGCATAATPSMPPGYSWSQAKAIKLEPALEEISGISYEPKLNAFISINDEKGKIYALNAAGLRVAKEFSFAGKGDYEDIVRTDNNWYVLRSDGHLWEMGFNGNDINAVTEYTYPGKKAEFEAMYLDETAQQLVLIVKNAKRDAEDKTTYGYAFDLVKKSFSDEPVINIPWPAIAAKAGIKLKTFHPSAAAVNPVTGEIYVLASIEKLLVVLDAAHTVTGAYQLDPTLCLQPEGIAFGPKNDLYISNEAAGTTANIIIFPYQSKPHK